MTLSYLILFISRPFCPPVLVRKTSCGPEQRARAMDALPEELVEDMLLGLEEEFSVNGAISESR